MKHHLFRDLQCQATTYEVSPNLSYPVLFHILLLRTSLVLPLPLQRRWQHNHPPVSQLTDYHRKSQMGFFVLIQRNYGCHLQRNHRTPGCQILYSISHVVVVCTPGDPWGSSSVSLTGDSAMPRCTGSPGVLSHRLCVGPTRRKFFIVAKLKRCLFDRIKKRMVPCRAIIDGKVK